LDHWPTVCIYLIQNHLKKVKSMQGEIRPVKKKNIGDSDQSITFLGIRDIEDDPHDGEFIEEPMQSGRRDPEESLYDEAGRPVNRPGGNTFDLEGA
jgi:hypothetical protein